MRPGNESFPPTPRLNRGVPKPIHLFANTAPGSLGYSALFRPLFIFTARTVPALVLYNLIYVVEITPL